MWLRDHTATFLALNLEGFWIHFLQGPQVLNNGNYVGFQCKNLTRQA
jgi:hypothetical protein